MPAGVSGAAIGICEERGSGFDKVGFDFEFYQLPVPDERIDAVKQNLTKMDNKDKVRACYQHCCLFYVSNKVMSNTTLRERFNISASDYPVTSRIIRDTVYAELIKLEDPTSKSRKHARYVPFWA